MRKWAYLACLWLVFGTGCSETMPDVVPASTSESPDNSFQPQLEDKGQCSKGRAVTLDYCYDGDTCDFNELEESVRLARIDTPEMNRACHDAAKKAREALLAELEDADQLCLEIKFEGYYGRHISELYADGENMSDYLLGEDYADEYGEETCDRRSDDADEGDSDDESDSESNCPETYICSDLATCEAAKARMEKCGDHLDGDGDGVPCEKMCHG